MWSNILLLLKNKPRFWCTKKDAKMPCFFPQNAQNENPKPPFHSQAYFGQYKLVPTKQPKAIQTSLF